MNDDVHTLIGAYALDALDSPERERVDAHLAGCPDCAVEVAELRATAARLGAAVAEPPAERLRERVLARVAETRQAPPPTSARSAPSPAARPDGSGGAADELHSRRRRPLGMRLMAVAATVALAAVAALGVVVARTQSELDTVRSQLAQAQTGQAPLQELLNAPDLRTSTATGAHNSTAMVLASARMDGAVVMVSGMPPAPAGQAYELWLLGGGQPRSAGMLQDGPGGTMAPMMVHGLDGRSGIGLTMEPASGSARPTSAPMVVVPLPV